MSGAVAMPWGIVRGREWHATPAAARTALSAARHERPCAVGSVHRDRPSGCMVSGCREKGAWGTAADGGEGAGYCDDGAAQ